MDGDKAERATGLSEFSSMAGLRSSMKVSEFWLDFSSRRTRRDPEGCDFLWLRLPLSSPGKGVVVVVVVVVFDVVVFVVGGASKLTRTRLAR